MSCCCRPWATTQPINDCVIGGSDHVGKRSRDEHVHHVAPMLDTFDSFSSLQVYVISTPVAASTPFLARILRFSRTFAEQK